MTTAAATAPKPQVENVVLLPLKQLHKSPTQPRRRGGEKLDPDFVSSILEKGVLQPIVARLRQAGGWEIVFGHRRYEGSMIAGLATIPAIVRSLSDEDVFEAQLIENVHREDMHPLDEAFGFERMTKNGRTATEIAARVGRPLAYVMQRLKLCDLSKGCREALDKEKISLGVALYLSRVPAQLQDEALKRLTQYHSDPTVAEAKRILEEDYLLRLDQAPFDVADANLVAKAGACTSCPKRTGQQRELFPDAARADLCIDRVCYRGKLDAEWLIRKAKAKETDHPTLEGAAAKKALDWNGGFKKLDGEEWIGGSTKKIRTLFGKNLPTITLARDDQTGAIIELVRKEDVEKMSRKASRQREPSAAEKADRTKLKNEEAKASRQAAAAQLAIAAAVGAAGKLTAQKANRLLLETVIGLSWEANEATINRRSGEAASEKPKRVTDPEAAVMKLLAGFKRPDDFTGLAIELVLQNAAPDRWNNAEPIWHETLKAVGLKFETFEKQVAAQEKTKAAPAKTAKKKAG